MQISQPVGVTCGAGVPSKEGLLTVRTGPEPHCPKTVIMDMKNMRTNNKSFFIA
jgi:hypothetical protein